MKKLSICIGVFFMTISFWSCQKDSENFEPALQLNFEQESKELASKKGSYGQTSKDLEWDWEDTNPQYYGPFESIEDIPFYIFFWNGFLYVPNEEYTGTLNMENPVLVEYKIAQHPIELENPWTVYNGQEVLPNLISGNEYIIQTRVILMASNGKTIEYAGTVLFTAGPSGSFNVGCDACDGAVISFAINIIGGNSQVYAWAPAVCCG